MEKPLPEISLNLGAPFDIGEALKKEWIETNGLGGYASSTILGINTRKYHGLLVAAFNPPVDRRVLLAKLDEEVLMDDQTYVLGVSEDTRRFQPEYARFPTSFSLAPFPTYLFDLEGKLQLKKTLFMPHERNASIILYEAVNASKTRAMLSITPLVNARGFHSVMQRNQVSWSFAQAGSDQPVVIQPSNGLSRLILFSTSGRYVFGPSEWVETYYRTEAQRGESSVDFNYKQGYFELNIPPNETKRFSILAVAAPTDSEAENLFSRIYQDSTSIDAIHDAELKRRASLLDDLYERHADIQFEQWLKALVLATDTFIVNRVSAKTKSVIAGYHWFADWGRDSLISLAGLTLITGRFDDAKNILLTFHHYCDKGIVPNAFPDSAKDLPAYNTVDASLWYVNTVLQFLKYTNDFEFVRAQVWPTLESIVDNHENGTVFNIHVDEDGLLAHGPQLTWMDAASDGRPVTPREGKAVEIQALWYNSLRTMQLLASHFDQKEKADMYRLMAEKTKRSFLEKFVDSKKNFLFDVVIDNANKDNSLRPNQIMAISLDFTMLDKARAEQVVNTVWKELWTPFGLRTLSKADPRYFGKYNGGRYQRDRAYHQGTAWPWLLGPFVTAFLKLKNHETQWRSFAFETFLKPLFSGGLYRAGLGSISEIFDGDPPHEPRGCIAQAWSVAEPFRAYIEDVLFNRPRYEEQILLSAKTAIQD
jgi:predicted glycogen debranching enzyme